MQLVSDCVQHCIALYALLPPFLGRNPTTISSDIYSPNNSTNINNGLFPYQSNTINPRGMGGVFDSSFTNGMFGLSANSSSAMASSAVGGAFKKTSVSQLKTADSSRNNSTDSINTQETLMGGPQEGFGLGLGLGMGGGGGGGDGTGEGEIDGSMYAHQFDIRDLVDWDEVEKLKAGAGAEGLEGDDGA